MFKVFSSQKTHLYISDWFLFYEDSVNLSHLTDEETEAHRHEDTGLGRSQDLSQGCLTQALCSAPPPSRRLPLGRIVHQQAGLQCPSKYNKLKKMLFLRIPSREALGVGEHCLWWGRAQGDWQDLCHSSWENSGCQLCHFAIFGQLLLDVLPSGICRFRARAELLRTVKERHIPLSGTWRSLGCETKGCLAGPETNTESSRSTPGPHEGPYSHPSPSSLSPSGLVLSLHLNETPKTAAPYHPIGNDV